MSRAASTGAGRQGPAVYRAGTGRAVSTAGRCTWDRASSAPETELWLYYSGSPLKHNEAELDALAKPENKRVFSRAVARLDGLVCAQANDKGGAFTTPPLSFSGDRCS